MRALGRLRGARQPTLQGGLCARLCLGGIGGGPCPSAARTPSRSTWRPHRIAVDASGGGGDVPPPEPPPSPLPSPLPRAACLRRGCSCTLPAAPRQTRRPGCGPCSASRRGPMSSGTRCTAGPSPGQGRWAPWAASRRTGRERRASCFALGTPTRPAEAAQCSALRGKSVGMRARAVLTPVGAVLLLHGTVPSKAVRGINRIIVIKATYGFRT